MKILSNQSISQFYGPLSGPQASLLRWLTIRYTYHSAEIQLLIKHGSGETIHVMLLTSLDAELLMRNTPLLSDSPDLHELRGLQSAACHDLIC
jgi:hypothetical protein